VDRRNYCIRFLIILILECDAGQSGAFEIYSALLFSCISIVTISGALTKYYGYPPRKTFISSSDYVYGGPSVESSLNIYIIRD
jgi:hypothetical protein